MTRSKERDLYFEERILNELFKRHKCDNLDDLVETISKLTIMDGITWVQVQELEWINEEKYRELNRAIGRY